MGVITIKTVNGKNNFVASKHLYMIGYPEPSALLFFTTCRAAAIFKNK